MRRSKPIAARIGPEPKLTRRTPSFFNSGMDGTPGPALDAVDDPVFSEDGSHLAYWARQGAKQRVVLDGAPGPEYDEVIRGGPAFRADGKLEFLAIQQGILYRVTRSVPAKP